MDYLKTLQDASVLESAEAAAFNNNRVAAASAMALAGARQVLAASTDSAHVGKVRALAGSAVSDSLRQRRPHDLFRIWCVGSTGHTDCRLSWPLGIAPERRVSVVHGPCSVLENR